MATIKKYTLWILPLAALFFAGCEEKIDIETDNLEPALVVDGLVKNNGEPARVELYYTGNYFGQSNNPPAVGALVTITTNDAAIDTLTEVEPGYYESTEVEPIIGATYKLRIVLQGETYEANSTMVGLNPLDTVTYEFKEEDLFTDEGYYVTIYTQEDPTPGNYFRFRYTSNGEVLDEIGWAISDEFVNGNYIVYSFDDNYPQEAFDTVSIEVLSISEEVYEFYVAADDQQESGNLFDTPPGNAVGNISNGAFGVFQASASITETVIIIP